MYSQTCVKQEPKGKPKSGCLRQMFFYLIQVNLHILPLMGPE